MSASATRGPAPYTQTYGYNTIGNMTSKNSITYTYDALHKHAVASLSAGESYTYDANGNIIAADKDVVSDALGGRAYYMGRLELEFPTSSTLKSFGLRPSAFVDVGSVWKLTTPLTDDIIKFCTAAGQPTQEVTPAFTGKSFVSLRKTLIPNARSLAAISSRTLPRWACPSLRHACAKTPRASSPANHWSGWSTSPSAIDRTNRPSRPHRILHPFWQHNVGICTTLCCENEELAN